MSAPPVISFDELAAESVELLPKRETLSCQVGCVSVTNVVGVNVSIAVNAASINASANALAAQYLASVQH